jgi:hypothetical protein
MTATEAAVANHPATGAPRASAPAPAADSNLLNPNAPQSYTVKRGDTLWGIASLFLKDPWLWPEVWYVNPQIANPHLIYPGDTLTLAYGPNGKLQITLQRGPGTGGDGAKLDPRLRSIGNEAAIPTIPYTAIAAFLSRPTVLSRDQIRKAPHVIAFRDEHQAGGAGVECYVSDVGNAQHARFSVIRVGDPLRDPEDGSVLGYEGIYTATALVSEPGRPTKALLIDSARETLRGDKLLAGDSAVPLNFMLRSPKKDVRGHIISVIDGTQLIGQYQIVIINRGTRQGVDAGTILAVDHAGEVVRDVYASNRGVTRMLGGMGSSFASKVRLPTERTGTLLVFKAFDRMSYALVVGASNTIHVADVIRNP